MIHKLSGGAVLIGVWAVVGMSTCSNQMLGPELKRVRLLLIASRNPSLAEWGGGHAFVIDDTVRAATIAVDDRSTLSRSLSRHEAQSFDTLQLDETWVDFRAHLPHIIRWSPTMTGVPKIDSNYTYTCIEFVGEVSSFNAVSQSRNIFTQLVSFPLREAVIRAVRSETVQSCAWTAAERALLKDKHAILLAMLKD